MPKRAFVILLFSQVIFLIASVLMNLPSTAEAAPTGLRIYVALGSEATQSTAVFDDENNELRYINTGGSPTSIIVNQDGTRGWTSHGYSHNVGGCRDFISYMDLARSHFITHSRGFHPCEKADKIKAFDGRRFRERGYEMTSSETLIKSSSPEGKFGQCLGRITLTPAPTRTF